jgi:hypothetical protein
VKRISTTYITYSFFLEIAYSKVKF